MPSAAISLAPTRVCARARGGAGGKEVKRSQSGAIASDVRVLLTECDRFPLRNCQARGDSRRRRDSARGCQLGTWDVQWRLAELLKPLEHVDPCHLGLRDRQRTAISRPAWVAVCCCSSSPGCGKRRAARAIHGRRDPSSAGCGERSTSRCRNKFLGLPLLTGAGRASLRREAQGAPPPSPPPPKSPPKSLLGLACCWPNWWADAMPHAAEVSAKYRCESVP